MTLDQAALKRPKSITAQLIQAGGRQKKGRAAFNSQTPQPEGVPPVFLYSGRHFPRSGLAAGGDRHIARYRRSGISGLKDQPGGLPLRQQQISLKRDLRRPCRQRPGAG